LTAGRLKGAFFFEKIRVDPFSVRYLIEILHTFELAGYLQSFTTDNYALG
jgi:hypothetical protein